MAAGLKVAIKAMGSGAWEVRNAASLIFTALIIRMLGFRNLVKVCIQPLLGYFCLPDWVWLPPSQHRTSLCILAD